MRKLLFFILFFTLAVNSYAQKYSQITWLGYGHDSNIKFFDIDDQGSAYIIISGNYDVNFAGVTHHQATTGSGVLGKFSSSGRLLWTREFAGSVGNYPLSDLKVDADHNVYVCGSANDQTLDDGSVAKGGYLIKLNSEGKTLWSVSDEHITADGFLALSESGIFWASIFKATLNLQGNRLTSNNPQMGTPDAFVAKVSKDGVVSGIFHDPARSSVAQAIVAAENNGAAIIMSRGGPNNKACVLLDENAGLRSDKPFFNYGDFPRQIRATAGGYKMLSYVYLPPYNVSNGYFDINFDKNLVLLDSTRVYPDEPQYRLILDGIYAPNQKGYYLKDYLGYSVPAQYDWLFSEYKGATYKIKDENPRPSYLNDAVTRSFVKMIGDTLNMAVRYFDNTNSFTFHGKSYTTPSYLYESYFWIKYLPEDADSCGHIKVAVVQNGIEGSQDVKVKFSLPKLCPATDDITIKLAETQPSINQSDFVLPASITIKKGDTTAIAIISVLNDNVMEPTETFPLSVNVTSNNPVYSPAPQTFNFDIIDDDNSEASRKYSITYPDKIKEGESGVITIALNTSAILGVPVYFTFNKINKLYEATPGIDHTPINIVIPAGSNKTSFNVSAFQDNLIEGDEYVYGTLTAAGNALGNFNTADSTILTTIIDIDNTPANRTILITPAKNTLDEGSAVTYSLSLADPLHVQYPLAINLSQTKWYSYINLSSKVLSLDLVNSAPSFKITYPDDDVIRPNKLIELLLSASNDHTGTYSFKWRNVVTDTMVINTLDNDLVGAALILDPLKLIIREGRTDSLLLTTKEHKTFEDNVTINLQWNGADILSDGRIKSKTDSVVLRSGKTALKFPVHIADDNIINKFNDRVLTLNPVVSGLPDLTVESQNYADVHIIDDDVSFLTIPNSFTPNGDGINDLWNIANLSYDDNCIVQIFNRYGQLVYSSRGYAKPWDGSSMGSSLPGGTYYYKITFYSKIFSGYVSIIR